MRKLSSFWKRIYQVCS